VPKRLELADVVAGVAAMFERRTAQIHQTLERVVPAGLTVQADRDRLVQILVNLVDNAVKFTPEGGRVDIAAGPNTGRSSKSGSMTRHPIRRPTSRGSGAVLLGRQGPVAKVGEQGSGLAIVEATGQGHGRAPRRARSARARR
jgi:signal transduction histidine kinase